MLRESREQEVGLRPRGKPVGEQTDLSKYPKGKKLPIPEPPKSPKRSRRGR